MGLHDDIDRFRQVGEERRLDLEEYIKYGDLAGGRGDIEIPIKVVDLPEFHYNQWDAGGVGQGDAEQGDPVDAEPQPSDDGDEEGDPGEEAGEHGYYEMNPEEFADELDDRLDLNLDPKGKKVVEEVEGDFTEVARNGPDSTVDIDRLFKEGLKRKLALNFDEEYLREVLKVDGIGPQRAFEWARGERINVSRKWLDDEYEALSPPEKTTYDSIEDVPGQPRRHPQVEDFKSIPIRQEDKRHKYPETIEKKQKNVVVVNIRDVSGSMREEKRELVERTFTPLDWYLQGKYDHAEFIYIAHDVDAWEVERENFFGIKSGGGTRISSAYELAQALLEEAYPYSEWNRYVFAAGDGENANSDTVDNVIPLIKNIDANLHAYVETDPPGGRAAGQHADLLDLHIGDRDNLATARVSTEDDVIDAIESILSTESSDD